MQDSAFDLEINGNFWILEDLFKIFNFKINGNLETCLILGKREAYEIHVRV